MSPFEPIPSRRGIGLPWLVVTFAVLMGFASMMVDMARVQSVKTQLQSTADAAARAAVSQISTSITAAQNEAVAIGSDNTADNSAVVIDPNNDVLFGTWSTTNRTFTTLTGSARSGANAIQIVCHRTAARGNAVPLLFASLVGKSSCDVSASATAYIASTATGGPGFVGLSTFAASGLYTDSYSAPAGAYSSSNKGAAGSVISNTDIYAWSSTINGNAQPGNGNTIYGATVSGKIQSLTGTLSYTNPTFPGTNNNTYITAAMNSSTGSFSSGNLSLWGPCTLPGGTYVLSSFACSAALTFTGPVNLYVTGTFALDGNGYIATYNNDPANLFIVCNNVMGIFPYKPLYADIFSPTATLGMAPGSASDFYGQIIVSVLGIYNFNLHYDTALPSHSPSSCGLLSGSSTSTISLVQ